MCIGGEEAYRLNGGGGGGGGGDAKDVMLL